MLSRAVVRAQESDLPAGDRLVHLHLDVRTRNGEIVSDLGIEDFTIVESDRRQTIRSFAPDAETPLMLGVLMDASASERRVFDQVHDASYGFLRRVLRREGPLEQQDNAFVMLFDSQKESRRLPDRDLRQLEGALRIAPLVERRSVVDRPPGGLLVRAGEPLYDAVVRACGQNLKWEASRKVCIVVSDGIDYGSEATLSAAIESAQRADTAIYSIQYFDSGSYTPLRVSLRYWRGEGALALRRMSRETGGAYFQVSEQLTLEAIYAVLEKELRSGYSLLYTPDPLVSGYRRVHIDLKRAGLIARYREGYYAESRDTPTLQPRVTAVDPVTANAGEQVTVRGNELGRSNIRAVYLTDGVRTLPAALLGQTPTAIQFQVPAEAVSGAWTVGRRRPFEWTLMLEAANGTMLTFAAFTISAD